TMHGPRQIAQPDTRPTGRASGTARALVRSVFRRRSMTIGGFLLAAVDVACAIGPWLLGIDPDETNLLIRFVPPVWSEGGTWQHPLGTDNLGRDMLARILAGGRISLVVAICTVMVAVAVGLTLGVLAGYFGGWVDTLIMRIGDLFLAY